jgi:hypothetical protein
MSPLEARQAATLKEPPKAVLKKRGFSRDRRC